jgi:hypothetical protein
MAAESNPDRDRTPRPWRAVLAWSLFAIGLLLRLLGVPFNGQHDVSTMVINWGGAVRDYGLANVFIVNYGALSYAVYGAAFQLAEHMPRYWWAPYKLFTVASEILVLIALRQVLPPSRRHWALVLYWINPWFILHGAWQGFWDGPHTFLALLAALYGRWVRDTRIAWMLAGACLMTAGMLKPQGVVYFTIPVGLYALCVSIRNRSAAWGWYTLGVTLVLVSGAGLLLLRRGSLLAIPLSFLSALVAMPNLCNGCLNIWRPTAGVLMAFLHQRGGTWELELPRSLLSAMNLAVLAGVMTLLGAFAWKAVPPADSREENHRPRDLRLLARWFGTASLVLAAFVGFRLVLGGESPWVRDAFLSRAHIGSSSWSLLERLLGGRYPLSYTLVLAMALVTGCILTFGTSQVAGFVERMSRRLPMEASRVSAGDVARARSDPLRLLSILALASLLFPQLGTSAHINHSYAGLVLLIPFAVDQRRIAVPWAIMIAIHFYGHLSSYGLGLSTVFPHYPTDVPLARALISRMAPTSHPALLEFQNEANRWIATHLPHEPLIMVLSAVNFVCTLVIARQMFGTRRAVPAVEMPARGESPLSA